MRRFAGIICAIVVIIFNVNLVLSAETKAEKPKTGKAEAEKREAAIIPQTTCPVMGGKIDKSLYVDCKGKRIYVCCKDCLAAVKKEPEKYIKKLESEGITLAETPCSPVYCPKCGELKGCEKCCKEKGRTRCPKCGRFMGSPGCCNPKLYQEDKECTEKFKKAQKKYEAEKKKLKASCCPASE